MTDNSACPNPMSLGSQSLAKSNSQAQTQNAPKSKILTSDSTWSSTSIAFQQIKQTQASLARLNRTHNNNHNHSNHNPINQNSNVSHQQSHPSGHNSKEPSANTSSVARSISFVDCLFRRFKDCFSEDFCSVPVFVVGNLSPGSDGTHLILPPCVSLGGQQMSRFASPRNLRHLVSIRESCRSIEELDLGGNKLNDLIEVYKILQYTPNLKFLNLSGNDLSRSQPIAMASTSQSSSPFNPTLASCNSTLHSQRLCLSALNNNNNGSNNQARVGGRRHSTLGQSGQSGQLESSSSQRTRLAASSARRLASATAAVAQSKKTSSSMASKLANSIESSAADQSQASCARKSLAGRVGVVGPSARQPAKQSASQSTMNLARSMSSLSSKDVVARRSMGVNKLTTGRPATKSSCQQSSTTGANLRRSFCSIKALALNNTGCQWRVVCSILSRMPNLEELHLSLNNYEKIDLEPSEFRHPALKRLYLCNNPKLSDFRELSKLLLAFPSLECLSMADCNISQIPENLDRLREWRRICGLNINGWPIAEWPVVERLNQLPSLVDLKCRNLLVLNTINDEPRHHLIARLPKLQRLNGSEIEEREHAEKSFVRFFLSNSHLERPSRFHELVQIHGELAPVEINEVNLAPPSHASVKIIHLNRNFYSQLNGGRSGDDILMTEDFLAKLTSTASSQSSCSHDQQGHVIENFEGVDENECDYVNGHKLTRLFKDQAQEVVSVNVDLRQSVRKFRQTMASIFGLNSQNVILYYIDYEMVGLMGPEVMKHNQRKLWNYNVQDGDQFIVEEG